MELSRKESRDLMLKLIGEVKTKHADEVLRLKIAHESQLNAYLDMLKKYDDVCDHKDETGQGAVHYEWELNGGLIEKFCTICGKDLLYGQ